MNRRASTLPFQRRFRHRSLMSPTSSAGLIGGRDANGNQVAYKPDPLRERSLSYTQGGYMSAGYDSGRLY